MKKKKLSIYLIIGMIASLMFIPPSFADKSAIQIGDALCYTGGGVFLGILVITDGSNAVTVTLYDNTSASGTKIIPTLELAATPRAQAVGFDYDDRVLFVNGIYADITIAGGGTADYQVFYRR